MPRSGRSARREVFNYATDMTQRRSRLAPSGSSRVPVHQTPLSLTTPGYAGEQRIVTLSAGLSSDRDGSGMRRGGAAPWWSQSHRHELTRRSGPTCSAQQLNPRRCFSPGRQRQDSTRRAARHVINEMAGPTRVGQFQYTVADRPYTCCRLARRPRSSYRGRRLIRTPDTRRVQAAFPVWPRGNRPPMRVGDWARDRPRTFRHHSALTPSAICRGRARPALVAGMLLDKPLVRDRLEPSPCF